MSPSSESDFDLHHPQPLLIVISGPSGAGKDTVMQRMKERGLPFHFVVTATTCPRRTNGVHGKDYWFVSKEEFAAWVVKAQAEFARVDEPAPDAAQLAATGH